ncbi:MucR family transcriptional regulator [Embleya sp. NPDC020630]|uniref:MucR family transcriptional regulator n=1 Tax=Embleya sp. NPDC020630 TaxID=3363979 RepID=UPI00378BB636
MTAASPAASRECRNECGSPASTPHGLCLPCDAARVGLPDGHGVYGVLDDDGATLLCHECGVRVAGLNRHVTRAHAMTIEQYRAAHGLRRTQPLVSKAVSDRQRASALRRMAKDPAAWARLEAARDPRAAVAARTAEALRGNAATLAGRRAHPGPEPLPLTARACTRCGTVWTPATPAERRRWLCGGATCPRKPGAYRRPLTADETAALRTASTDPDELVRLAVAITESGTSLVAIAAAAGVNRTRLSKSVRQVRAGEPPIERAPSRRDACDNSPSR